MKPLLKALFILNLVFSSFTALAAPAVEITILKTSEHRIVFETDYGKLVFSLFPDIAPKHVAQITRLVETGAYDSTRFFRVMPG